MISCSDSTAIALDVTMAGKRRYLYINIDVYIDENRFNTTDWHPTEYGRVIIVGVMNHLQNHLVPHSSPSSLQP